MPWGWFEIEQRWLLGHEVEVTQLVTDLIRAAMADGKSINGVILPEYALGGPNPGKPDDVTHLRALRLLLGHTKIESTVR